MNRKAKGILLSLILSACAFAHADNVDISGTYTAQNEKNLTINKSKDGTKYVISTRIKMKATNRDGEILGPYKVVTYEKENTLYELSNDSIVGTIKDDEFTFSKNNKVYKKKL